MNANQIINMVMRTVLRRLVNGGINAGINAVSKPRKGGQAQDQGQNGSQFDGKQARQTMRVTRKMTKF